MSTAAYQTIVDDLHNYHVLKPTFSKYQESGFMNKQDFFNFTNTEQGELVDDELFRFHATTKVNGQFYINFQDFIAFILHPNNDIYDIHKKDLYQEMDFPLTDYWINSSHNTYLTENQFTSESSVQAYISAFQKGCRCVELDCWDGPDNVPLIYHGYTMTSKITFESVIKTISEYGFKYSRFPLILSLEVHCSAKQQDIMADIINDYLGPNLLLIPFDYATTQFFPSLKSLQEKIIIKHRGNIRLSVLFRSKIVSQSPILANPNEGFQTIQQLAKPAFEVDYRSKKKQLTRQNNGLLVQRKIEIFDVEQEPNPILTIHRSETQTTLKPKYKLKFIETLTQIQEPNPRGYSSVKVTPLQQIEDEQETPNGTKESVKLSAVTALFGVSMNIANRTVWEISSLDESKVSEKQQSDRLIDFHRKYFSRIYPAGTRVDSSNYDPVPAYNSGSQIVALNFQTNDMGMLINTCKFLENGGLQSGYILKPQWMRSDGARLIRDMKIIVFQFTFKLILAFNLRNSTEKRCLDPVIKITVRGIPQDEQANKPFQCSMSQDGFNQIFNSSNVYHFRCPELAFIIVEVSDAGKQFVGWTAIPVSNICFGFRVVHLLNQHLKPISNSGILVHVIRH